MVNGAVAVVTGGGGGIGGAVSMELARLGAKVVVVDPGAGVEGEPLGEPTAAAVADRIRQGGGWAEASTVSVTDRAALQGLFDDVRTRLGSLDVVVNPAGILRSAKLPDTTDEDWAAVLGVHLTGYLNVLSAALPLMVEAGHGRVVGFTSGVGLARSAGDAMIYGAAKRAVAALTWQLGPMLPPGVTVNALSPIAATRMVRSSLAGAGATVGDLDLSDMPQPADMAPAASFLCGESIDWCRGRVVFSAGSELSVIGPPRVLEAVRTEGVGDYRRLLDTVMPAVLAPAEARQHAGGGSNPRFGDVFSGRGAGPGAFGLGRRGCLVVGGDDGVAEGIARCLPEWGRQPVRVGTPTDELPDGLAAVVVGPGLAAPGAEPAERAGGGESWRQLLADNQATANRIAEYGSWLAMAARYSLRHGRPLRVVMVARCTGPGDEPLAQAVAQLARCVNDATAAGGMESYSVRLESDRPSDLEAAGHLVGRLVAADDAVALKGAELVVGPGWLGLRSHPAPLVTVSFGGGPVPGWVGEALEGTVL